MSRDAVYRAIIIVAILVTALDVARSGSQPRPALGNSGWSPKSPSAVENRSGTPNRGRGSTGGVVGAQSGSAAARVSGVPLMAEGRIPVRPSATHAEAAIPPSAAGLHTPHKAATTHSAHLGRAQRPGVAPAATTRPQAASGPTLRGVATFYGTGGPGEYAAMHGYQDGNRVVVLVTAFHDGRTFSVTVPVVTQCSACSWRADGILVDLSVAAWDELGWPLSRGVIPVNVLIVEGRLE